MATWIFIWLIVTVLSTIAVMIVLFALWRHASLVGRSAKRLQAELGTLTDDLSRQGARANERASSLQRRVPRSRP